MSTLLFSSEQKVNESLLQEIFKDIDTSMYTEVCFFDLDMSLISRVTYLISATFKVTNEDEEEKKEVVFEAKTDDAELYDAYKYGYEDYFESEEEMVKSMISKIDIDFGDL